MHRAAVPIERYWLVGVGGCAALSSVAVESVGDPARNSIVIGLALLGIAASGLGMREKKSRALPRLVLDANLLIAVAVIGICLLGKWSEAAVVAWLFAVLKLLEALVLDRPRDMIRRRLALSPPTAMVVKANGASEECPAAEVTIGSRIRVLAGMRIPLDGKVAGGRCFVDESPVTGDSVSVEKRRGDPVFAGSIAAQGVLDIIVTATANESLFALTLRVVEEAMASRIPLQQFVDRLVRIFIPIAVGVALVTALAPPLLLGQSFSLWSYRALVLLVIAYPFALVRSVQVALASALAATVKLAALIKDGVHLEALRHLKLVVFAKAGVLTEGRPRVSDVVGVGSVSSRAALVMAAALSSQSTHPIAAAITAQWASTGDLWPLPKVDDLEVLPGRGMRGFIDGRRIMLGSPRFVAVTNKFPPEVEGALARLLAECKTTIVLARDGVATAVIAMFDPLRHSARQAVEELRTLGIKACLLSGDDVRSTEVAGGLIGIDDVRAALLPAEKVALLPSLGEEQRTVAAVGRGTQDASMLTAAGVGISIAAAEDPANNTQVALLGRDLRKIPQLIALSRQLHAVLIQNIAIAIGAKLVLLALAVSGAITLWMAIVAELVACAVVVANSQRLSGAQGSRGNRPLGSRPA